MTFFRGYLLKTLRNSETKYNTEVKREFFEIMMKTYKSLRTFIWTLPINNKIDS